MEDFNKFEELADKYILRFVALIGLILGIVIVLSAHGAPDKPIDPDMEVKVKGLVCPSCAIGIKKYLKREVNVKYVSFDTVKEVVLIDFIEIEGRIHYKKMIRL